eukprot:364743-Chlamydomonas_euryale.AAC.34
MPGISTSIIVVPKSCTSYGMCFMHVSVPAHCVAPLAVLVPGPVLWSQHAACSTFLSQEISRYVEHGVLDAGICGSDWIAENRADVIEVAELKYSKSTSKPARWVLAVPENSKAYDPEDLADTIIASELVQTTKQYFADRGIAVKKVEYSSGATEVKAMLPGVGGIVDVAETGASLQASGLRIVDTILESTTRLVANKTSWADPAKRQKIEDLAKLLQVCAAVGMNSPQGALNGRRNLELKMDVPIGAIQEIQSILPNDVSPKINQLVDKNYVEFELLIDEKTGRDILPACKRLGAVGISTYKLDLIVN